MVGVHTGVTHLGTCWPPLPGITDDAGHVANRKALAAGQRHLDRLNRQRARQPGSRRRRHTKSRLARTHRKVVDARRDAMAKLTTGLATRRVPRWSRTWPPPTWPAALLPAPT